MTRHRYATRTGTRFAACLAATLLLSSAPAALLISEPAQAQVTVRAEFRTALEPYGRWQSHSRWGDVWIPRVARDWTPYTRGRWVYTDDWGWFWNSDDDEAAWGWIAFHYGRWVHDGEMGWVWISGEEWSPGWVQWRRGHDHVGWAPLPPDDVVVEYVENPEVWVFVRSRDLVSPNIATVILPVREQRFIRETVLVNRTVVLRERRYAVNPGIPPAYIAAAIGRPLRAYDVRPHVLANTVRFEGAVEVRAQELRGRRDRATFRDTIRESRTTIRPADRVPPPRALAQDERGRLGDNPPRRAARGEGAPQTEGRGDQRQGVRERDGRPQDGRQFDNRQQQGTRDRPGTDERQQQGRSRDQADDRERGQPKGRDAARGRDEGKGLGKDGRPDGQQQKGTAKGEARKGDRDRPGTEGRGSDEHHGADERRQGLGKDGRGMEERGRPERESSRPKQEEGKGRSERMQGKGGDQRKGTEGRGDASDERRMQRRGDGEGQQGGSPQRNRSSQDRFRQDDGRGVTRGRAPEGTQGPGGVEQRGGGGEGRGMQQRSLPQGGTEGRGGGARDQGAGGSPRAFQGGTEGRGGGSRDGGAREQHGGGGGQSGPGGGAGGMMQRNGR